MGLGFRVGCVHSGPERFSIYKKKSNLTPLDGRFSKLKELVLSLNKVLKESKNQVKDPTLNCVFLANSFMRTATSLKIFKIPELGFF